MGIPTSKVKRAFIEIPLIEIPPDHPRRKSLEIREKLVDGVIEGAVALQGLIAHGRGECFDYLLGEETQPFAIRAIEAAAAALLLAKNPVISVNGNTAVLVPKEVVELAKIVGAEIEINLFYRSRRREEAIARILRRYGAVRILGIGEDADATIPELHSERRRVSSKGILKADTILVSLEDGDRTESLVRMGKLVIAIDLNPLSRTARSASITIVDNIVRAMPKLVEMCKRMSRLSARELRDILRSYRNEDVLREALLHISERLRELAKS